MVQSDPGAKLQRCDIRDAEAVDALIEAVKPERIYHLALKIGNLNTKRDITDIKDCVAGLYLALEQGEAGEVYNLCGGRAYQISDLLKILLKLAKQEIDVEVTPELLRPSDEPIRMGDNTKLWQRTGWQPLIPIEQTLEDIMDYWRAQG
jgi:GDP-4-dehydro-6-deoxy-D-mannose reductase